MPDMDHKNHEDFLAQIQKARAQEKQLLAQAAEQSERMLRLFRTHPTPFYTLDANYTITSINPAALELFEMAEEDVLNHVVWDLFPGLDIPFRKSYEKALQQQKRIVVEGYYQPSDKWYEVGVYPFDNGLAVSFFETTDRKKSEVALATERQKFEKMIAVSPIGIALIRGEDLVFELVNERFLELVGPREYLGRRWADVYSELTNSPLIEIMQNVLKTGETYFSTETPFVMEVGPGATEERFYDFAYIRINDSDNVPYGIYCQCSNVTDRVQTRQRLETATKEIALNAEYAERERLKFEAAFHSVAEGIFIFDSNGNPVFMNDAAAKVFGSASAADVRRRVEYYFERLDLYDLDDNLIPLSEWPVARALRGESFRNWHIKAHRTDTNDRWIWSSSGELAKQTGIDVTLAVVVLRDITNEKRIENELRTAKADAEKANQLKSAFLANMSHEIRTPLGVMLGFTDLILDPDISDKEKKQFAETLKRNGQQLTVLIDDILDLSKVEAGHLSIDHSDFYLHSALEDVLSALKTKAHDKNIGLKLIYDHQKPDLMNSDMVRLKQILTNLVGNAIKFTERGEVTISAFRNDERVKIEVSDTGIGINDLDAKKLFKPFSQADESMTRKYGGTGLGLALSKRLAQLLGGDLTLKESARDKGSVFLLDIPNYAPQTQIDHNQKQKSIHQAEIKKEINLDGLRILLVEDSPDNQYLISQVLKKKGAEVIIANNGQEGVTAALNDNFNVVVMDIQMPVMDGYTATEKLRHLGYRKPIIALTAHAMTDIRKRCLEVGYTDHMPKPIDAKALVATVARYAQ